ncbi:MAG: TRAP transporter substrate-binding protein DctP, partial [Dehalococcoidia bacterium]|nr:TRAP transporter substrate-binding protein DctP [Dehalococcoidia bacterium]
IYKGCRDWAAAVTQMSGGRLTVKDFPGGAIVPALKEMFSVHEGTLDATFTGAHYHTSEIGLAGDLFNLYPAGLSPRETLAWVYDGGGMELWQEMYDRKGLNIHVMGPGGFSSAETFGWYSKEMKSLSDFKGLKFRTAGVWGEMVNEMGGAVTSCPGGEIYQNMERGVLDAFEFSTPSVDYSVGFHELGAYLHGPGIHAPQSCFELLVNKDQWNELSPDLQAICTHAAEAMTARIWAFNDYHDAMAMEDLATYGTKFVYLPEDLQEEIVKVANAKYAEIAAEDEFFAKVLESQREFVIKYRALKNFIQPDPNIMTWGETPMYGR